MKRILLSSLFIVLFAAYASSQTVEGLNVITLRVGDNLPVSPDAGIPHLSLAYEYEFLQDAFDVETLCLGAGASIGYRHYRRTGTYNGFYFEYGDITWSLRATAHYDLLGQLLGLHDDHIDTYATLSLGMEHSRRIYIDRLTGREALNKQGDIKLPAAWSRRLLPGIQAGVRYWFTPNLGAVAEIGFDGFSFVSIGVSTCF